MYKKFLRVFLVMKADYFLLSAIFRLSREFLLSKEIF